MTNNKFAQLMLNNLRSNNVIFEELFTCTAAELAQTEEICPVDGYYSCALLEHSRQGQNYGCTFYVDCSRAKALHHLHDDEECREVHICTRNFNNDLDTYQADKAIQLIMDGVSKDRLYYEGKKYDIFPDIHYKNLKQAVKSIVACDIKSIKQSP
jgi:hypothetical protein